MRDNDIYRQVIRNSFIMKNAWEDWAPYRNNLTELVLSLKPGYRSEKTSDGSE